MCHPFLCLPYLRSRVYTQRPSLAYRMHHQAMLMWPNATQLVIASTWLFAYLPLSHRVFLLACPPLIGTGAIALPSLLLHVFANSSVVHLQFFCDVMASNSRRYCHFDFADWWALRPGHTQAASIKKMGSLQQMAFGSQKVLWSVPKSSLHWSHSLLQSSGQMAIASEKVLWRVLPTILVFIYISFLCWGENCVNCSNTNPVCRKRSIMSLLLGYSLGLEFQQHKTYISLSFVVFGKHTQAKRTAQMVRNCLDHFQEVKSHPTIFTHCSRLKGVYLCRKWIHWFRLQNLANQSILFGVWFFWIFNERGGIRNSKSEVVSATARRLNNFWWNFYFKNRGHLGSRYIYIYI